MSGESPAAHWPSHTTLLRPRAPHADRRLDAIVISAVRSPDHLLPSMELAAVLETPLVVLGSGATHLPEARGLADEVPGLRCLLVDLEGYEPPEVLEFETDDRDDAGIPRLGDLNVKRNLALVLAHHCQWATVLMLDDDIGDLSPTMVRAAAATLEHRGASGMIVADFPDNSVVGHALRWTGVPQEVFVTGSALIVDTTTVDSFFPNVYNEDWLYLFDKIRAGLVAASGTVSQLTYGPFVDPRRSATEEFGDVLAEGLMSLLHAGMSPTEALKESWWGAVLQERASMLSRLTDRLAQEPAAESVLTAVKMAWDQHSWLDPEALARYVQLWRADVRAWRARLGSLPRVGSVDAALASLGLRGESETLLRTA